MSIIEPTRTAPTPTGTSPAEPGTPARISPAHNFLIWILLAATFVVFLNETVVSVAMPSIMDSLDIDAASVQWLLTAFMLTMAVVIPMSGFLIRRFSTKRMFIAAMALFTLGTLVGALAPGFELLVAARVIQAAGTGVMMPLLMTTIMELVPLHERGRMMGRVSIVIAAAPALGPLLGGLVINWFDWRAIFIMVLPVAVIALALGIWRVVDVAEAERVPFDMLSVVLSALGFGGLVFGLSELGHAAQGVAIVEPWVPLAAGGGALALFVWRQLMLQRVDDALIDLRILAVPGYLWALLCTAALCAVLFGTNVLLPLYLQDALGLTALASGLIVMPGGLLMGLAGPIVGRWYDRVGPRPLVIPGAIAATLALGGMALVYTLDAQIWAIVALHVVLSAGMALMFSPLFTAGMGSLTKDRYSYGSAMLGTIQQLAGAAGTAAIIVIYTVAGLSATAGGATAVEATAAGTHQAFLVSAIAFVVVIGLAVLLRRPAEELVHEDEPTAAAAVH